MFGNLSKNNPKCKYRNTKQIQMTNNDQTPKYEQQITNKSQNSKRPKELKTTEIQNANAETINPQFKCRDSKQIQIIGLLYLLRLSNFVLRISYFLRLFRVSALSFVFRNLVLICYLEFVVWDFSRILHLFRFSNFVLRVSRFGTWRLLVIWDLLFGISPAFFVRFVFRPFPGISPSP